MRKITYLTLSVIGTFFIGCGGGGSSNAAVDKTLSGSVEASYLQNVKVCLKDTEVCTLTNSQGKFSLAVDYPADVDLYIGDYKLGSVKVTSKNYKITPAVLADANVTLSGYLGAFLHFASTGTLNTNYCNMNNIKNLEINSSGDTIVEKLKNYNYVDGNLTFSVNDKNYTVTKDDLNYYITSNPVKCGVNNIIYNGAATVGDYAEFNLNYFSKEMSYKFSGKELSNVQKNVKIYNLYRNMFYIGEDSSSFFFITRGVMISKIVNSKGSFDVITLPHNFEKLTIKDVSKNYNILVKGLNVNGVSYEAFVNLTITPNKTYLMYLKPFNSDNVLKLTGKWDFDSDDKLVLYDDNNQKVFYLKVKKGLNKNSVVLDGINGGFGLGVEAKDITRSDLKTYHYLNIYPIDAKKTKVCFGYTNEKLINSNKIEIKETDEKCFIARSYPNKGVITFEQVSVNAPRIYTQVVNPVVSFNGVNVKLSGIGIDTKNISILDGDNGFYINYSYDKNQAGSIGSDRGLD